jgi:hypothetical protein
MLEGLFDWCDLLYVSVFSKHWFILTPGQGAVEPNHLEAVGRPRTGLAQHIGHSGNKGNQSFQVFNLAAKITPDDLSEEFFYSIIIGVSEHCLGIQNVCDSLAYHGVHHSTTSFLFFSKLVKDVSWICVWSSDLECANELPPVLLDSVLAA